MVKEAEHLRAEKRQESHPKDVVCTCVEGGVKMLHPVMKPTPWRGGATLFRTFHEHAEEKCQNRGRVWEMVWPLASGTGGSESREALGKIPEQGKQELASAPLRVGALRKEPATSYTATTGVEVDGCSRILTLHQNVETAGVWPTTARDRGDLAGRPKLAPPCLSHP